MAYYAVIFTSERTDDADGYAEMSRRMVELAQEMDGFLAVESARAEIGITVSYWRDLESIRAWRENAEHRVAQKLGRERWYRRFTTRICRVEREYSFERDED